jgi:WD40 repeat protein
MEEIIGEKWIWVVKIWDAKTYNELATVVRAQPINAVAFSPDGKFLAVALSSTPGEVKVYDCADFKERASFPMVGYAMAVVFSPDGQHLAAASEGEKEKPGLVKVWAVGTWQERSTFRSFMHFLIPIAFSPDSTTLALGDSRPGTHSPSIVRFADPVSGLIRSSIDVQPGGVHKLAYFPDGRTLLVITGWGPWKLWDLATGQEKAAPGLSQCYGRPSAGPAISPDGTCLAIGSYRSGSYQQGHICFWDIPRAKAKPGWAFDRLILSSLVFSPDGKRLAGGGNLHGGVVKVWAFP